MAKKARVWNGSSWQDLASSTADLSSYANLNTTPISGFRNAVINGGMDIWQRGTSFSTNAAFTADRWQMYFSGTGTTMSVSQVAPTLGNAISGYEPSNVLRCAIAGGSGTNALSVIQQKIEDVRSFAGQTVTLSFWAKATSGTPNIAMDFYQDFGVGGSTYVYLTGKKITATTSWNRYTTTFTIPSVAGKTIGANSHLTLRLWMSAGSNNNFATDSMGIQSNTFDIWGVQVEKGTIATPFEQRPIGTELDLCKRYYQTFGGNAVGTTIAVGFADAAGTAGGLFRNLSPTMRVAPASGFFGTIFITDFIVYRPLTGLTSDRNTIDTFYSTPSYSGGTLNATRPAFAYSTGGFITLNAEL
jgi:hypothetical protein